MGVAKQFLLPPPPQALSTVELAQETKSQSLPVAPLSTVAAATPSTHTATLPTHAAASTENKYSRHNTSSHGMQPAYQHTIPISDEAQHPAAEPAPSMPIQSMGSKTTSLDAFLTTSAQTNKAAAEVAPPATYFGFGFGFAYNAEPLWLVG